MVSAAIERQQARVLAGGLARGLQVLLGAHRVVAAARDARQLEQQLGAARRPLGHRAGSAEAPQQLVVRALRVAHLLRLAQQQQGLVRAHGAVEVAGRRGQPPHGVEHALVAVIDLGRRIELGERARCVAERLGGAGRGIVRQRALLRTATSVSLDLRGGRAQRVRAACRWRPAPRCRSGRAPRPPARAARPPRARAPPRRVRRGARGAARRPGAGARGALRGPRPDAPRLPRARPARPSARRRDTGLPGARAPRRRPARCRWPGERSSPPAARAPRARRPPPGAPPPGGARLRR